MKYLSTSEVAEKSGCSRKTINNLAKDNKIPGAILVANHWMIPESYLNKKQNSFRFPFYIFQDFFNMENTLVTDDEKRLYQIFKNYFINTSYENFDEIKNLLNSTTNLYIQIQCLYSLIFCNIFTHNYKDAKKYYYQFLSYFNSDFEYKKEMELLYIDIMTIVNGYDYLLNYNFDFTYPYSESVYPKLAELCGIKQLVQSFHTKVYVDPSMYELSIKQFEEKGYIFPLISLHSILACIYYERNDKKTFANHIKQAYDLSSKYHNYYYLAEIYALAPKMVDKALDFHKVALSDEFKNYMRSYKASYLEFMNFLKKYDSFYNMKNDDMDYLIYAVKEKTNKEVSYLKGISEKAVSNRYIRLYGRFNVQNKRELVELFLEKINNY